MQTDCRNLTHHKHEVNYNMKCIWRAMKDIWVMWLLFEVLRYNVYYWTSSTCIIH